MSRGSRPTQVDVARLAGVSRQTVSLVVRDDPRVAEKSRRSVREAMRALGYYPNMAARVLAAHTPRGLLESLLHSSRTLSTRS